MDEDCIAVAEGADLLITGGTSHFTVPWRSFLAQGLQVHLQSTQTRSWWNVRSLNVSASVPHHFHFYLLKLSNAGVSMKCDMCLTLSQPWRISNSGLQRIPRCPAKALWLYGARGCLSQRWCEAHRLLHQVCSAEVWWGSWGVLGKLGSWVWVPSAMMPVKWQFVYYLCPLLDFTEGKRGLVARAMCQVGGWESQGHWGDVKSSTWFLKRIRFTQRFTAWFHCATSRCPFRRFGRNGTIARQNFSTNLLGNIKLRRSPPQLC